MEKTLELFSSAPWYFWGLVVFNLFLSFLMHVCIYEERSNRINLFASLFVISTFAALFIIINCAITLAEKTGGYFQIVILLVIPLLFLYWLVLLYSFEAYYEKQRHKWGIPQLIEQKKGQKNTEHDIFSMDCKNNDRRFSARFWSLALGL